MNENALAIPTPRPRRTQRLPLLLLAALFLLPFGLGSTLFWLDWRPPGSTQHGELVQPARPLPETGLQTPAAAPLSAAQLKGKWLLVAPQAAACDAACGDRLQQLLQVHRALGKEQSRVQPVLIAGLDDAVDDASLAAVEARFPDLVVARVAAAERKAWQFVLGGGSEAIFIIDPFGNVMMRYRAGADRRGVLKDLERLLKYSWLR